MVKLRTLIKYIWTEPSSNLSDSDHPRALFCFRLFAFIYTSAFFGIGFASTTYKYPLWMTHWGVFMTMTYFGFSLYCYKNSKIHPYMHLFLELILPVEIIIGIVYWSYVYPLATIYAPLLYNISVHGGCGLFLLIEMCLNKVYLIKNHWIIAGLFNVLYTVFINMPYAFTHETPLYPLITYTNVWTYLVFLYEFVILILSYEAIRHFKQRPRVELPVYQSMTYLHRSEQV